jgi:hypothetical protein
LPFFFFAVAVCSDLLDDDEGCYPTQERRSNDHRSAFGRRECRDPSTRNKGDSRQGRRSPLAAASINPIDWKLMNGEFPGKTSGGVGFDVSGTVERLVKTQPRI